MVLPYNKAASDSSAVANTYFASSTLLFGVYTEFGIDPLLPKGTDFGTVSDEKIAFVEEWINNLPRKILNYHSSAEVFCSVSFDIAI